MLTALLSNAERRGDLPELCAVCCFTCLVDSRSDFDPRLCQSAVAAGAPPAERLGSRSDNRQHQTGARSLARPSPVRGQVKVHTMQRSELAAQQSTMEAPCYLSARWSCVADLPLDQVLCSAVVKPLHHHSRSQASLHAKRQLWSDREKPRLVICRQMRRCRSIATSL